MIEFSPQLVDGHVEHEQCPGESQQSDERLVVVVVVCTRVDKSATQ
jgi:hypothetical protein